MFNFLKHSPKDDFFRYVALFKTDEDVHRHANILAEWSTIRTSLGWGVQEQPQAAVDLLWALRDFMSTGISREQWLAVAEPALRAAEGAAYPLGQARIHYIMGEIARYQSQYADATAHYQQALTGFTALANQHGRIDSLCALAEVAYLSGDLARAESLNLQAERLFDEPINPKDAPESMFQYFHLKARIAFQLGEVFLATGNFAAADARFETALPFFIVSHDPLGKAHTFEAQGRVAFKQAQYDRAKAFFEQALDIFAAENDHRGQASVFKSLADVAVYQKDYGRARDLYQQALFWAEQIGDLPARLNTLRNLSSLEKGLGNPQVACHHLQVYLRLANAQPYFKDHPITDAVRKEYAQYGCP